ncbi:MAG: ABC transporter permease [Victivallales bacterium]|nr:ABC transporter permease [Victivallales bacterium]
MLSRKSSSFELILAVIGGLVLLFILAPLFQMFFSSDFNSLLKTAGSAEVQKSIWMTIWISILGTFLFSFFAIPFSYMLARKDFPLKRLVCGIIDIPVVIPHSAAGIALLGILSEESAFGSFLNKIGISFVDTEAGIMVAMIFVSLPFLINSAKAGFESVPLSLEKTAYTLGASPGKVFFTVSLPIAWRSILSGFVMMWARGLSEFGAVVIIAYHPTVTSVLIYERFTAYGLKYAQPVAVIFIIVCLIVFILFRLLSGKNITAYRGFKN